MTDGLWTAVAGWTVPTALAGAAVFGLALVVVRGTRPAAGRERAAAWAVGTGLLAAALAVLPAWVPIEIPNCVGPAPRPAVAAGPPPLFVEAWAAPSVRVADAGPLPDPTIRGHVRIGDEAVDTPAGYVPEPEQPVIIPPTPAPVPHSNWRIADWLFAGYLAIAAGLLVRLLAAHVGLARLAHSAAPAPARIVNLAAGLPGYSRQVRLLVTDRLTSPVCFGLSKPTILVPRTLSVAGTDEQLKWVLGHELDHLQRGDPWTGLWTGLAGCVFFPLPPFWAVRHALRLAQEQLADAAATAAGGRAVDYAAFLVSMAGKPAPAPDGRLPIRPGRSDLYRRVTMLLDAKGPPAGPVSRVWACVTAGGLLATGVFLSGVGLAADDAPPANPKATKAEQALRAERLTAMLDGPPAVEAEVKRLERTVEGLQKTADELKDAPEAKAAILRTIEAYKKKIAEAKAKGELVPPPQPAQPPVPPMPPQPPVPAMPPVAARLQDSLKRSRDQLAKATDEVLKAYEQQLGSAAADPARRKALEQAIEAYKAAMAAVDQQLLQAPPAARVWRADGQNVAQVPGLTFGKGRLGVALGPIPDVLIAQFEDLKDHGQLITSVFDGSPAAKAGVRVNDVLLSVAGKPVTADPTEVVKQVADMKAGEPFDLVVLRKGQKQTLKGLVLAETKPAERRTKVKVADEPADDGVTFSSVSVSVTDNEFAIKAERDGVKYTLTGSIEGGKPVPATIVIRRQGDKASEYAGLAKVPAEHKAAVESLLKKVNVK